MDSSLQFPLKPAGRLLDEGTKRLDNLPASLKNDFPVASTLTGLNMSVLYNFILLFVTEAALGRFQEQ